MHDGLRNSLLLALLVLGMGCGLLGGSSSRGEGDVVEGVGRIHYVESEGDGFFGITTAAGGRYLPLNLPQNLQRHDTSIRFRGRVRTDVMTIGMWGTPLEIEEIEVL